MTTGNNYSFAAPNTNNSDNFLVKLDHRFDDRSNLSGRYIFGDGSQTFPLTSGNGSPSPEYQTVVPTRIQLFGLNLSQVLSNGLINKTRLGYNRFVQTFTPLDAAFDPASIGLVTGAQSLPTITITGFVSLGAPTNVPRGRVSSGYQFVDNLTWARGAHTFTDNYGLFAQDDWKVTPRLTLNLGLRYEYLGIFKEQGDRLSNFIPGIGLTRVGDASLPDLVALLYLMIQVVCIGTLPGLADSERPLVDASSRFLGAAGASIVSVGALISVTGTLNSNMLAGPRILFAMAEQGQLPQPLAATHRRFRTPHIAILTSSPV